MRQRAFISIAILICAIALFFVCGMNPSASADNIQMPVCTEAIITDPSSGPIFIVQTTSVSVVVTETTQFEEGKDSEEIIWNFLLKYAPNEYAASGAMSMIFYESNFKSNAVYGWTRHRSYDPTYCEDFVAKIDKGLTDGSTREQFVAQSQAKGGYGLCQYWSAHYLYDLYDFAQEWGTTTIADAEMQCAFIFYDIENNRPKLWENIINVESAYDAGILLGVYYEGVGANAPNTTAPKAQQFYEKYVCNQGE